MKKVLFLGIMFLSLISCSSTNTRKVASVNDLLVGDYVGTTKSGERCSATIREQDGYAWLMWSPSADPGDRIYLSEDKMEVDESHLTIKSTDEAQVCKAKIYFSEDGRINGLKAGCGMIFKLTYDLDCRNMIRQ